MGVGLHSRTYLIHVSQNLYICDIIVKVILIPFIWYMISICMYIINWVMGFEMAFSIRKRHELYHAHKKCSISLLWNCKNKILKQIYVLLYVYCHKLMGATLASLSIIFYSQWKSVIHGQIWAFFENGGRGTLELTTVLHFP